ncbi:MAG: lipoate--protein ligase family protein [Candidatus Thorarchaeota archaeon]
MPWRLLDDQETDIYHSLAIDEALARVCAHSEIRMNTVRFWRAESAVVIGRFQCVHEEVNIPMCQERGIHIARRFTGGGAVYQDAGNLNFTICGDQRCEFISRRLQEFYDMFVGAVTKGLRNLGVPAEYVQDRYSIRVDGKKVTGTAGWVRSGVSFLHGTLLIESDLDTLNAVLRPIRGQPVYLRDRTRIRCKASHRDTVTNLRSEMKEDIDEQSIRRAILEAIEESTGESIEKGEMTREEETASERLYQERYSQSSWNLGTPVQKTQQP